MDEQVERRLREQLEEHVGQRLSDDEWETFKRIQLQSAPTDWSGGETARRRWTGRHVAACIAALVAAFAGVGLLLQWDFVFLPLVRVPLGIFVWLIAVAVLWVGVRVMDLGDWLLWGWIWGLLMFVPFVAAGGALLFKDRGYLTSTQGLAGQELQPAEVLGWGLILASLVLAWIGRPTRSSRR